MARRPDVVLDEEQAAIVRKALRIGLICYGEIEQRRNADSLHKASGNPLPQNLRVLHPTGTCDVVSDFAAALSYLG